MGVAVFLFRTLMLQREKSSLNLRLSDITRKKLRLNRSASAEARVISGMKKAARQELSMALSAKQSSNTSQAVYDGGTNNQYCFGLLSNSKYQEDLKYDNTMQEIEMMEKEAEERKAEEELEIENEQRLVQTQLEMVNNELKSTEQAMEQAAKDGAPKYVA